MILPWGNNIFMEVSSLSNSDTPHRQSSLKHVVRITVSTISPFWPLFFIKIPLHILNLQFCPLFPLRIFLKDQPKSFIWKAMGESLYTEKK